MRTKTIFKNWLTSHEASLYSSLSERTINHLADEGYIQRKGTGWKTRYSRVDIDKAIRTGNTSKERIQTAAVKRKLKGNIARLKAVLYAAEEEPIVNEKELEA